MEKYTGTAKETLLQQAQTIRHDAMHAGKVKKGCDFNIDVAHLLEVSAHALRQDAKLTESQQLLLLRAVADMLGDATVNLSSQAFAIFFYIRECRKENQRHH